MTNLEKLKAWQEKEIAENGLIDVKLFPSDAVIKDLFEYVVSGKKPIPVKVSEEELEKAAGDLLELLEGNGNEVDITNEIF